MNILSLTTMEFYKIKRSKILLLLTVPLIILWLPNVINAHMSAEPVMEGISPANNFLIQSFMGYVWFILPASIIVCTVMMQQRNGQIGESSKCWLSPFIRLPFPYPNSVCCCLLPHCSVPL